MFQRNTGAPSTPTIPLAQAGVKAWDQVHCSGTAARPPAPLFPSQSCQHWRGPAPVIFLFRDSPSDWLRGCFAVSRETASQDFGKETAVLLLEPTSKLLTAAVGGAEKEAVGYRGSILSPLGTPNLPIYSVSSEPEWQFQGHTYPE